MITLEAMSVEGAILDAIKEAHNQNKKVLKLGLPLKWQHELTRSILVNPELISQPKRSKFLRLKSFAGIKVSTTRLPQITTQFSFFKPL